MNPGKLNKRIKIYSYDADVEVEDEGGGFSDDWSLQTGWTKVLETWASIRPASEKAMIIAGQQLSEVSHTILVRYNALIKPSHVINFKGRRLDIETIKNFDESDTYLKLMCIEKVKE